MASALSISVATVKYDMGQILERLQLKIREQAVGTTRCLKPGSWPDCLAGDCKNALLIRVQGLAWAKSELAVPSHRVPALTKTARPGCKASTVRFSMLAAFSRRSAEVLRIANCQIKDLCQRVDTTCSICIANRRR